MNQEPEHFPINGVLDLHTFKPGDISSLIPEYIEACLDKNITSPRIIHGKGTAALRRGFMLCSTQTRTSFLSDSPRQKQLERHARRNQPKYQSKQ